LGLLQVGLVGHHCLNMPAGQPDQPLDEGHRLVNQLHQLSPQLKAESQPGGFPPRAPGVQPTGRVAEPADEVALAGVVGLAVVGVVGKLGRRYLAYLEQETE
jgi:hypothetical protein